MRRFDRLLLEAARAFSDGRDPFSDTFLIEHTVTSRECQELSDRIGVIVAGYIAVSESTQTIVLVNGAAALAGIVDLDAETVENAVMFSKARDGIGGES